MKEYDFTTSPERVLLERANQQRRQAAHEQVAAMVRTGQRTWGQLLLGSPVKPPRVSYDF